MKNPSTRLRVFFVTRKIKKAALRGYRERPTRTTMSLFYRDDLMRDRRADRTSAAQNTVNIRAAMSKKIVKPMLHGWCWPYTTIPASALNTASRSIFLRCDIVCPLRREFYLLHSCCSLADNAHYVKLRFRLDFAILNKDYMS